MSEREGEELYFNGVDFATGEYLRPPMAPSEMVDLWRGLRDARRPGGGAAGETPRFAGEGVEHLRNTVGAAGNLPEQYRFWAADIDPQHLHSSGWGVIFPHGIDKAIREALAPLLEHRRRLATLQQEGLYRELIYRPGESLYAFLERHEVGPGVADPAKMPYYLMLVGTPEEIPFEFQFELDVQYAVGRLSFLSPADYAGYAAGVLTAEAGTEKRAPHLAFFASCHKGDRATEGSFADLVQPLRQKIEQDRPSCRLSLFAKEEASKERFLSLMQDPAEVTDLLFTSTHGLGLAADHPQQGELQGALVMSDWSGPAQVSPAPPTEAQIVSAADLGPSARLGGGICFLHGCFTAGTPRLETFSKRYLRESHAQAPVDFISTFAQRLLATPGGALAVIGHVDKTWTSSFRWRRAGSQIETYASAIKELLSGKPVGLAMEVFGLRHAELSAILQSAFDAKEMDEGDVAHLWTAHHDARNFIVLGDPAIRLRARIEPQQIELPTTKVFFAEGARPSKAAVSVPAPAPEPKGLFARRRPAVQNLEIRIIPSSEGGFRCTLTLGSQSKSARIDLERCKTLGAEIYQRVISELSAQGQAAPPSTLLKEAGAELFEALFTGPLLSFLERTLERSQGRPLRLLVRLDPESRSRAFLSTVPWEWLYWREKQDFLSLNRRTPVVRFVEVDAPAPPELESDRLRVLILTSEHEPAPEIALECQKIVQALSKNRRIVVQLQHGVSLTSLREAFAGEGFHVVHFIGHGLYARSKASAQLVLEEPSGRRYALSGEDLAQTLRDFAMLRLVFFNSCDTARTDDSGYRPFAGVAQALLQNGVPAVIAMQFPISHPAATSFSERFYRSLTAGDAIDAAVAEGRQAIRTERPETLEWGTPVLFVRTTSLDLLEEVRSFKLLHWALGVLLLVLLVLTLMPRPSRADVELSLTTSYVRFQLPEKEEPVFDRMILEQLGALDLREIELAPADQDKVPESPRLDLLLAARDPANASITLQQSVLPGNSWVAIRREEDGSYHLSIETERDFAPGESFEALARGPYEVLIRPKGRAPRRFEAEADPLEVLRFLPRARQTELELRFHRLDGKEFRSPIHIEGLELFEVVERTEEGATRHEAKFDLSGKAKVGEGEELELARGSQLRLQESHGVLERLVLGEKGIEVAFSGSVAGIRQGVLEDPKDLMPRRSPAIELFGQCVAVIAGLMTLIEFVNLLRPLFRLARSKAAARSSTTKNV